MEKQVLIIGPSGSGKSYVSSELRKMGLKAVDADVVDNLHSWYDQEGNKVRFPKDAGEEFLNNHHFLWDRNYLVQYLAENPELYLFGLSGNIFEMTDLFDDVYFLQIDPEKLDSRLQMADRLNPMGKTEYQRQVVKEYAREIEGKARDRKLKFIDANLSPQKIFSLIK